ncbi:hypothetical protein E2C01_066405 [Portunus trituberculatus]|uniref:Uncharacterized protein n=1 Tax=Portunus trituberculatus TaxID=210409 RepID=A0A5B7HGY9_PORTR|nr:hypothetical protein [Portunus trituberculatus]
MTPVLKNDWEIYKTKTKRSRNNSESSAFISSLLFMLLLIPSNHFLPFSSPLLFSSLSLPLPLPVPSRQQHLN